MAEFAVFMYHPGSGTADPDARAEHDAYANQMTADGEMVFGRPVATTATSLRADGVTAGPYIQTSESMVGFYVVQAADLEAALVIARRNPILRQGGGVEVRPIG